MTEHTFEELKHMNVADLREIAAGEEHEAVQGYTQLKKEQLIPALCTALDIEMHEHHEVVGVNKVKIKAQIRRAKEERDNALASGDKVAHKKALRRIHRGKRTLRRAME